MPRPKKQPPKVRAQFPSTGANVWVLDGRTDPKPTVTLMHDYPDLAPAVGWHVQIGADTWEVTAVNGQLLALTKLEVPGG